MIIKLQRVHYTPKELMLGVLYVSEEFGAATHLCACGCGSKVRTPLGPTAWSLEVTRAGPTLRPSVGNWQLPCQSHYWIFQGEIIWEETWSPEQITVGRRSEEERRSAYYNALGNQSRGLPQQLWQWLKDLFK